MMDFDNASYAMLQQGRFRARKRGLWATATQDNRCRSRGGAGEGLGVMDHGNASYAIERAQKKLKPEQEQ